MDDRIRTMFTNGATYSQIAAALRVTRNVVAGRCRKMGLRRDGVVTPNDTEYRRQLRERRLREQDQRDLCILRSVDEGVAPEVLADRWGVPLSHVRSLMMEAANA